MWFLVFLLLLEVRDWLQQEGRRWMRDKSSPCRTKQPCVWWVTSVVLKLRTEMNQLRNKNQSKNQWVASKEIICFFSADMLLTLALSLMLTFCGALGWLLHTWFLHQRSWFSHGLNEVFCGKARKGCGSFLYMVACDCQRLDLITQQASSSCVTDTSSSGWACRIIWIIALTMLYLHSGLCWEQDSCNGFWKS